MASNLIRGTSEKISISSRFRKYKVFSIWPRIDREMAILRQKTWKFDLVFYKTQQRLDSHINASDLALDGLKENLWNVGSKFTLWSMGSLGNFSKNVKFASVFHDFVAKLRQIAS